MNGIDILRFFNEICERRCRNQYHPDCNETRTNEVDVTMLGFANDQCLIKFFNINGF